MHKAHFRRAFPKENWTELKLVCIKKNITIEMAMNILVIGFSKGFFNIDDVKGWDKKKPKKPCQFIAKDIEGNKINYGIYILKTDGTVIDNIHEWSMGNIKDFEASEYLVLN